MTHKKYLELVGIEEFERGSGSSASGQVVHFDRELFQLRHTATELGHQGRQTAAVNITDNTATVQL